MMKKLFAIAVVAGLLFTACKGNKTEKEVQADENVVKTTLTDRDGKTLGIAFNNDKGTATIYFDNDTIELKGDTVASGLKFSNDEYTYTEWKSNFTLKRGDQIIATNEDDVVNASVKDAKGTTLDMLFNKTKGTAEMKLNGETIEMKQDTTASGIQFSNDQYKYTEWQGNITLKKGDKVVFEIKNDKK